MNIFTKKEKGQQTFSQKYSANSNFQPDMTPLEAAYIAEFYYMASHGFILSPQGYGHWEEIKRHWIITERKPK
jgi:hypothetical protein